MKIKSTLLLLALACPAANLFAQDFLGARTGNYTGVNGAFFNPASITGTPYRFDINLFSFNLAGGNDQATFKIGDKFDENQFLGTQAGNSNGYVNMGASVGSFMFNVGPRMSIALTTRVRANVNIADINAKLGKKITSDFENDPELPYSINSNDNMLANVTGWSELGLSVARELVNTKGMRLRAGFSLKYLRGAGNTYLNIANLKATMDKEITPTKQDAYLTNASGRVGLSVAGISFNDFQLSDLTKKNASGIGADFGLIYEWKHKKGVDSADLQLNRTRPDYILKFSVSLLDVGKMKFTQNAAQSGTYNLNVGTANRYYFEDIQRINLGNFRSELKKAPHSQYFTEVPAASDNSLSVSLPTTLQLEADYHAYKAFYISAGGQIPVSNNKSNIANMYSYSAFAVTPRLETTAFSLFFPLSVSSITDTSIGAGFRFGPLTVGSGSIVSLFSKSKQGDAYIGLHFGMLKKNTKRPPADKDKGQAIENIR